MKRSLLSGCIAFVAVGRCCRFLFLLLLYSIVSFRGLSVRSNVCVSARVIRKKVRKIDKQNESNGIEEKKRLCSQMLYEKGIDSVNPLLKNLSIFQYSSRTSTHIHMYVQCDSMRTIFAQAIRFTTCGYSRAHSIEKAKKK